MANTIDKDEIIDALRKFDRKKESDKYEEAAEKSRSIASAVGTDTPVTLLTDIRQQLNDIQKAIDNFTVSIQGVTEYLVEVESRRMEVEDRRHNELLAFINKMSQIPSTSVSIPMSPMSMSQSRVSIGSQLDSQVKYFYKGDELKTSQSVIGCMLLHLESMISRSLPSSIDISDTAIMGLKEWSSACTVLREASSNSTPNIGTLSFPKRNSDECNSAINIIATTISGRTVVCKEEHLSMISNSCPAIVRCVEEIRLRAIACPGIISSLRLRNLSAISFPYITKDDTLNITNFNPRAIGSATLYDTVKRFSIKQKKCYANLILEEGKKPMIAANLAEKEK